MNCLNTPPTHSEFGPVSACVTLDEQGMPPDFIKKRLRWLGESYRVYLRDTNKIDDTHLEVLRASASRTMEFVNKVQEDHSLIEVSEYDQGD